MDAQRRLLFRPDLAESILEDRILPSSNPGVSTTGQRSAGYIIIASLPGLSPALNSITGVGGDSSAGGPSSTGSDASSPATGNGTSSRDAGGSGAVVGAAGGIHRPSSSLNVQLPGQGLAGGIPIVIPIPPGPFPILGVGGDSSAGGPSSTGPGASSPATGNGTSSRGAGGSGRTGSGAGVGTGVGAAGGIPIVSRKAHHQGGAVGLGTNSLYIGKQFGSASGVRSEDSSQGGEDDFGAGKTADSPINPAPLSGLPALPGTIPVLPGIVPIMTPRP